MDVTFNPPDTIDKINKKPTIPIPRDDGLSVEGLRRVRFYINPVHYRPPHAAKPKRDTIAAKLD